MGALVRGRPAGLALVVAVLALAPAAAQAATFTVSPSAPDVGDATPDGACNTGGACSLREAVDEANALAGADTIVIAGPGTIALTNLAGDLDVSDDLTIAGAGMAATTIRQDVADRVLDVAESTRLTLEDLAITGGSAPPGTDGVAAGGGILLRNFAGVTLRQVLMESNVAETTTGTARGGAIAGIWHPEIVVEDSVLRANEARTSGPSGGWAGGGAIRAEWGSLTIRRSDFVDNEARGRTNGFGGAIETSAETVVEDSTFRANASIGGGAISVQTADATTVIRRSTLSENAAGSGAALSASSDAPVRVEDSTITGNIGSSGAVHALTGARVVLARTTVTANGGGVRSNGAVRVSRIELRHSILDDPGDPCTAANGGIIASPQPNLLRIADPDCGTGNLAGDPQLGPLGLHGGRTPVHPLAATSPAVDVFTADCGGVDQRGRPRPSGAACDLGAVEYEAPPAPPAPPPAGGTPAAPVPRATDSAAPAFIGRVLVTRRFRVARKATPVSARRRATRAGGTIGFRLDEAARATIQVRRLVRGIRVERRGTLTCRTATRRTLALAERQVRRRLGRRAARERVARAMRRRRCTAEQHRGTLRRDAKAGRNRIAFSGRIGRRALPAGTYRIRVRATDAAGNAATKASNRFRIVRR